jgi:putative membrane protein
MDGGFGLVALILSIVWIAIVIGFLALIVLAIRWLIRADQRGRLQPPTARPDDPLEILRQRYARGEIDEEEYDRRRRTLGG